MDHNLNTPTAPKQGTLQEWAEQDNQLQRLLALLDEEHTLVLMNDMARMHIRSKVLLDYGQHLVGTWESPDIFSPALRDICREVLGAARRELLETVVLIQVVDGRVRNVHSNIQVNGAFTVLVDHDDEEDTAEHRQLREQMQDMILTDPFFVCY